MNEMIALCVWAALGSVLTSVPPVPLETRDEVNRVPGIEVKVVPREESPPLVEFKFESQAGEQLRFVNLRIDQGGANLLDVPLRVETKEGHSRVRFAISPDQARNTVVLVSFGTEQLARRRYRINLGGVLATGK